MDISTEKSGQMTTVQGSSSMAQANQGGEQGVFIQPSDIYQAADIKPGQGAVAAYLGVMDVAVITSTPSVDALLANPEYNKYNQAQAAGRLVKLETLEMNMHVVLQEKKVQGLEIEINTEDQKNAAKAYRYSKAVSDTEQAKDNAETAHFMTGVVKAGNRLDRVRRVANLATKAINTAKSVERAKSLPLPNGMNMSTILQQASEGTSNTANGVENEQNRWWLKALWEGTGKERGRGL